MKARSKAFLWVLLVFLTGTLFGGTMTLFWTQTDAREAVPPWRVWERSEKVLRRDTPPRILKILSEELELDQEQRVQVEEILEEGRVRFEEIARESRKRFHKARHATSEEIRGVLRPEQQERFEGFLERNKSRRDRRAPRSSEHPDPSGF